MSNKLKNNIIEVKSSNKKMIYSNRILCFNNESTTFSYQFDDYTKLIIKFNFKYDKSEKSFASIKENKGSYYNIDLMNFDSSLGNGLIEPFEIGKYMDKSVYIIFFVKKISDANPILDLAIYMED